jgi:enoyl-CoA hydratase/carnithine racemase
MPEVTYERRGSAAVLTIDRPERRNAVDPATADQLLEAYREFESDDEARVLVLTGAGEDAFCAGADLKSVAAAMDDEGIAAQWLKPRPHGPLGFTRIVSPKPTIAAITGYALAGGLELALWCDLRVGTGTAKLGFPERRWGVPLIDGGTQRLPRIVGSGHAMYLALTGDRISAAEALQMGLISRVVDGEELVPAALEMAQRIAENAPLAVQMTRKAIREGLNMPLAQGLALERSLFTVIRDSEDRAEGRLAFREKRKPAFKGR